MESYIDEMVRRTKERFNRSRLKPILDNLGLKSGGVKTSPDVIMI